MMSLRSLSPSRSFCDPNDPYQPLIVEELLKGQVEWRNIQDIVRVSFRALTDTVKAQGQALRDLEKNMANKVSKGDFHATLSQKLDFTDFSEHFAHVKAQIEGKISHFEAESLISNRISEVNYAVSSKASLEQVESKLSCKEFNMAAEDLYGKLDYVHEEINRIMQSLPSFKDLEEIKEVTTLRINDINGSLKEIEEIHSALIAKKVNRVDFDSAIARKNEEMKGLHLAVEVKAEAEWTENMIFDLKTSLESTHKTFQEFSESTTEKNTDLQAQSNQLLALCKKMQEETEHVCTSLSENISKKADIKDLEKAFNIIYKKADSDTMHEQFSIQRKLTNESLHEKITDVRSFVKKTEENFGEKIKSTEDYSKQLELQIKEAKHLLKLLESEHKEITKDTVGTFTRELEDIQSEIKSELQKVFKSIEDLNGAKADREDFKEISQKLIQKLGGKADISDFDRSLQKGQKELVSSFQTIRDDYKIYFTKLENQMSAKFDQLITRNELRSALSEKADSAQVTRLISSKMNLEEIIKLKGEIESALTEMRNKASKLDLDSHVASTRIAIEELSKELVEKAYVKDICTLLDMKASIEDVNSALIDIHKELDSKISVQAHAVHLNEQLALNSVFCSENTVGRWIWRNGELANGFAVPWEIQCINTSPDNFIWEPDVTNIIVVSPGLYEITFGFYSKKKPTVQLLVNGETILSAVNNASYVIHHSAGRLKNTSSNSGTISGLTLIDFIALPPRAKVSLSYSGDRNCEGFLALKKL